MQKNYKNLIYDLIKSAPQSEADILVLKRKFAKKNKTPLATNSELLSLYRKMLKSKTIAGNKILVQLLRKRQIRTLSGVAPIAVLTKSYKCPGKCLYCPTEKNMPKSYLSNEPAVMRAKFCDFNPFKQVALRIKALEANGHETDKLELIIMGGTWDFLPEKYKLWFVYACFRAANNPEIKFKSQNSKVNKIEINNKVNLKDVNKVTWQDLYHEQKKNEKAKHRIVGLTLETRPDFVTEKSAWQMRELGCTRVELGVQQIDDQILKLNKRGCLTLDAIRATKILRELGFKITYHLMLNLSGSNYQKDYAMFKKIFSDSDFQPDQIKIYPCVVNEHAELYDWWKAGKYKPYSTKKLTELLVKIKKIVPYYVRIIRVIRDIPKESIAAGNKVTNLRDLLNVQCKCIRCREVGHVEKFLISNDKCLKNNNKKQIKLFIQKYKAGEGTEYFLSFESADRKILYAFCRLRLPKIIPSFSRRGEPINSGSGWLINIPIIRELHTYGQLVPISVNIKSASQHRGLGKKLLGQAEKIARQKSFDKLAVIAGIGVRKYYKKVGYKIENTYMVKEIK